MSTSIFQWKLEPLSPLLDAERDAWLFFEDESSERTDLVLSTPPLPLPSSRAELAQQLLDDIEDLVKKESTGECMTIIVHFVKM